MQAKAKSLIGLALKMSHDLRAKLDQESCDKKSFKGVS